MTDANEQKPKLAPWKPPASHNVAPGAIPSTRAARPLPENPKPVSAAMDPPTLVGRHDVTSRTTMTADQNQPLRSNTAEDAFQRARYFENLVELQFAYITVLQSAVARTGTAPPNVPHFPVLKGAAGDFDPNDR